MRYPTQSSALQNIILLLLIGALAVFVWQRASPAATAHAADVPAADQTLTDKEAATHTAVLAGGCFWGVEAVFEHVEGVQNVVSGYTGGTADNADYHTTSSGRTQHAESVRITYDPSVVRYTDLLQIFFSVAHDPTQVDRQGPDHGPQYRSAIFALDANQAETAKAYIHQLEAADIYDAPIATEVDRINADEFYKAEAYHQNFATRHPQHPYIQTWDAPKLAALKTQFTQRYRARPNLPVASR